MIKSRSLAEKHRERLNGDYSVTVDRSGTCLALACSSIERCMGAFGSILTLIVGGGI